MEINSHDFYKKIDLKNRDFFITYDDAEIFKFLDNNGFNFLYGEIPVVSTISDSTYGVIYLADDKYVFCKHKAIEINKGQKLPKFCTTIQKTCRIISKEDIDKNFRKTNMTEILILEMQEEKNKVITT